MALYKLHKNMQGTLISVIKDCGKVGTHQNKLDIPFDPANTDYQVYLEWAKTNTADPADPGPSDWDVAREKRDRLLKDSDCAMTTGATIDQAQWSAYREKLRDIPQTYKDKATSEIVWPTIPSSKGPNS